MSWFAKLGRDRDLSPAWLIFPIACALQIAAFSSARLDDAFITFRYGQNLALGHGMVFNPGERLMGSTSPVEVLLSALKLPLDDRGLRRAAARAEWFAASAAPLELHDILAQ